MYFFNQLLNDEREVSEANLPRVYINMYLVLDSLRSSIQILAFDDNINNRPTYIGMIGISINFAHLPLVASSRALNGIREANFYPKSSR